MNCRHCGLPLKDSIRIGQYKSCPNCSQNNSYQEHIFYPDSNFGFTEKRVTCNNSDGIQSWCEPCRSSKSTCNPNGTRCSNMK
jgi:hypothetical protein